MSDRRTSLEDVKREQQIIKDYFYKKPPAEPIQYYIVLGKRSIGKTHMIIEEVYKKINENEGTAFLFLFRKKTQMSTMKIICNKYAHYIAGRTWVADKGIIWEFWSETDDVTNEAIEHSRKIGYFSYLNNAETEKSNNFENPRITDIIFDEAFAFAPVDHEAMKFNIFRTTVARRTGELITPIRVWLTGNDEMGEAPIIDAIKPPMIPSQGVFKWRNEIACIYRSGLESPDPSQNPVYENVKDLGYPSTPPLYSWTDRGEGFELHQFQNHLYVCRSAKKGKPITQQTLREIARIYIQQNDYNAPIIYQDLRCYHIGRIMQFKLK